MADVVFILGAGASKEGGAPLMADFLDVARTLWETQKVSTSAPAFETVFKAIGHLQQVHSKAELDIINIESVFAAFEMGKLLGRLPGYSAADIDGLIKHSVLSNAA
ncbi:MAG: hypothetical protein ACYCRH_08255 [Acidiferrobacteraceae bacterium]